MIAFIFFNSDSINFWAVLWKIIIIIYNFGSLCCTFQKKEKIELLLFVRKLPTLFTSLRSNMSYTLSVWSRIRRICFALRIMFKSTRYNLINIVAVWNIDKWTFLAFDHLSWPESTYSTHAISHVTFIPQRSNLSDFCNVESW